MTLQEVAAATGMMSQSVAKAERATTDPRFSTVVRIARALGVSLDALASKGSRQTKRGSK
jgi:DNA-binding phage protein